LIDGKSRSETFKEIKDEASKREFFELICWLDDAENPDALNMMPQPHIQPISVIDIPFMWAFYYLNREISYEDALRDILLRGGDTDTNAAIVGGLLGAADGVDGINKD
jgi:ADP-ribosyl-[dinitrogen reductase] hydrolase